MAPTTAALYARGNGSIARSKITIPTEIICCRCKIVKNKAAFSAKYHTELLEFIANQKLGTNRFDPKVTKHIPCMACTGSNRVELECYICKKWKGLDAFSKQQRKNGDMAKCWPCMQEQLDTEPAGQTSDVSDDGDGNESEESNPYFSGDDDNDDNLSIYSEQTSTTRTSNNGVRIPTSGGTIYTGRSMQSSVGGNTTLASSSAGVSTAVGSLASPSTNRKFAKVPAAPRQSSVKMSSQRSSDDESDIMVSSDEDDDDDV